MLAAGQHLHRLLVRRRSHLGGQDEAVELGLRERIRAVELHGVLRRDDEERLGQLTSRAFDCDLALPHRLQQRRLGARGGAVDLVGQDDVGEDRARHEFEGQLFLVEDARSGDVRWQEVRRALDAPERASDRGGKRPRQHGLAGAWQVLQQHVTACDQARGGDPDDLALADDDPVHVGLEPAEQLGCTLRLKSRFLRQGSHVGAQFSQQPPGFHRLSVVMEYSDI